MAVHFLNIGGKERPLCFDQSLAYEYERTLNRSYLRDLNDLFVQIAQVGQSMSTNDIGTAAANLSVVTLVNFFYTAMRLGCRRTNQAVDFDEYLVADWVLGNQDAVSQFTVWLVEANVDNTKPDESDSKKKRVAEIPERIDWDIRLKMAAAIGMPEAEFWTTTPKYFYMRVEQHDVGKRDAWEQSRMVAFWMVKTVDSKNQFKHFPDLMEFPWDEKREMQPMTQEEHDRISDEADEALRQVNPELYARIMAAKANQPQQP